MISSLVFTTLELGLLYTPAVLGVALTFKFLNFPDLTVDGSLVVGAAAAALGIKIGIPGWLALGFALIAGNLAGYITAFLHSYVHIEKIFAGILSIGILYAFNLHLMAGPNISLLREKSIISWLKIATDDWQTALFLLITIYIIQNLLSVFLQSELGLQLRAVGDNEILAQLLGINARKIKFLGLGTANALVALSGGLLVQYQGFVDINMGGGTLILGLASLFLSQTFYKKNNITVLIMMLVFGSITYQAVISAALYLGAPSFDLKLISAIIVIAGLVLNNKISRPLWKKIF